MCVRESERASVRAYVCWGGPAGAVFPSGKAFSFVSSDRMLQ